MSDRSILQSSGFRLISRIFLAVVATYFLVLLLAFIFFPWQIYQLGNEGPGSGNISWIEVSPDYARDKTLFVGVGWSGVFRSTDSGKTWKKIRTERPIKAGANGLIISLAPRHSLLLISDELLLKSVDYGDSWRTVGMYSGESLERGNTPLARRTRQKIWKKIVKRKSWNKSHEDKNLTIQQQDDLRTLKARSVPRQLYEDGPLLATFPPDYSASGEFFIGSREGLYVFKDRGRNWEKAQDPLIARSVRIWSEIIRIFNGWPR